MITLLIILGIILNTILSHLVATTGEKKDIGYNTVFWTSFLFSPLIGLLLSIASPNNPEKVSNRWYRNILEKYNSKTYDYTSVKIIPENNNSKTYEDTVVKIVLWGSVFIFIFYVIWNT
jgi:Na+-driven multidrug efflux pump